MALDYNIGLHYLDLFQKTEAHSHEKKNTHLDTLESHNANLKDISELIHVMTQRKSAGKVSFTSEPELMNLIDRIRNNNENRETNQSILASHQYSWDSESNIEITLQSLNDHVKIIGQNANHTTMLIQNEYHAMNSITESARKLLEMIHENMKSIQSRIGR